MSYESMCRVHEGSMETNVNLEADDGNGSQSKGHDMTECPLNASSEKVGMTVDVGSASTAENLKVYPLIEEVCGTIYTRRYQRERKYDETQSALRNSQSITYNESLQLHKIKTKLEEYSIESDKIKRTRRSIVDEGLELEKIKECAEKAVQNQYELSKYYDEDAETSYLWFSEVTKTVTLDLPNEKKEILKQHQKDLNSIREAVEREHQRRKKIIEEKNQIKNQRKDNLRKGIEDKNSQRDDSRQKSDRSVTSNQSDGQELSMLQEKLKKVRLANRQYSAEKQLAKSQIEQDVCSLNASFENIRKAVDYAERETDCENGIRKTEEASILLIEQNKNMEKKIEENEMEEKASTEVKLIIWEETMEREKMKNDLENDLANFENSLRLLGVTETNISSELNPLEERKTELESLLQNSTTINAITAEELGAIESLIQYTSGKVDRNADALERKKIESDVTCFNTSEKIELQIIKKRREDREEKLRGMQLRITQLKEDMDNIKNSIQLMLSQNVRFLSNDVIQEKQKLQLESEKHNSILEKAIKEFGQDLSDKVQKLTNTIAEQSSFQEELDRLKSAVQAGLTQTITKTNDLKVKEIDLNNFKTKEVETEQEGQNLSERLEESKRHVQTLTDEISEVESRKQRLQEKSESITKLTSTISVKKSMLADLTRNKNERKSQFEGKRDELEKMCSDTELRLDHLEKEKEEIKEKINCGHDGVEKKRAEYKKIHEDILFKYDKCVEEIRELKLIITKTKREKIKLVNSVDRTEIYADEVKDRHNAKIKTARSKQEQEKVKYEELVFKGEEKLAVLRNILRNLENTTSEVKEKRKVREENGITWPKPILRNKSPEQDQNSLKPKKAVSFQDPANFLQIFHSDSSADQQEQTCNPKKRKLLPLSGVHGMKLARRIPK